MTTSKLDHVTTSKQGFDKSHDQGRWAVWLTGFPEVQNIGWISFCAGQWKTTIAINLMFSGTDNEFTPKFIPHSLAYTTNNKGKQTSDLRCTKAERWRLKVDTFYLVGLAGVFKTFPCVLNSLPLAGLRTTARRGVSISKFRGSELKSTWFAS